MTGDRFHGGPILNSPYEYPSRHWELDGTGQPTQEIIESRRLAEFTDAWEMQSDFEAKVEEHFNDMIDSVAA